MNQMLQEARSILAKCVVSEFEDVKTALYKWYVLACSKNIFPGGPELIEKTKQIAQQLGKSNFNGSNGWLGEWKARYNIKHFSFCGESGDVQGCTVDSWKERLPEIVAGYKKEDIWNMDASSRQTCSSSLIHSVLVPLSYN